MAKKEDHQVYDEIILSIVYLHKTLKPNFTIYITYLFILIKHSYETMSRAKFYFETQSKIVPIQDKSRCIFVGMS